MTSYGATRKYKGAPGETASISSSFGPVLSDCIYTNSGLLLRFSPRLVCAPLYQGSLAHSLLSALIKHWVDPRMSGLSPLDMRVHSTPLSSALQDARLYAWV
ncbi:hypothetical protein DPX16_0833 [Anabarilius grahami]|uniref:Uncharacterized protein n=1 Tax=Anabarilius grahami TaxID=495550 RepID=A0A3N0XLK2_ANAGA|nr:hypothetical protein DPX16_0833 [Anabarilius grahami]